MTIIVGIDPGSRVTGYGVIKVDGNHHRYLNCGCLQLTKLTLSERLGKIFTGLSDIFKEFNPKEVAIEQVFMNTNASSALKLGQARGAAISATAVAKLPLAEYSARQVKQAVVGYGAADKNQVQQMVKTLLNLSGKPSADAADALAVALCHAHTRNSIVKMPIK